MPRHLSVMQVNRRTCLLIWCIVAVGIGSLALVTPSLAQPAAEENTAPARASGSPAENSIEERADALMGQYDTPGSPGGIVGVFRDGEVVFAKGYGTADLAHGTPITPETRFNVGSVSKQFLAYGLALLAEQGTLSLDDPVAEYLPDWPTFEETVTLRHLLTHTSGYREAYGTLYLAGRVPGQDYLPREEALEVVRRQPALEFRPGSEFQYNSTAYVILAEVLRRATGEPPAAWTKENVLDPLGMEQTAIETEVGQPIANAADSYVNGEEGGFVRATSNRAIFGAAEVFTTVGDLAKWCQNYHTAELGGEAVQERMLEPFVLTSGDTTDYRLGIRVGEHRGLRRLSHTGGHAGFTTQLGCYPGLDGAGVVVMSNYNEVDVEATAWAVAEAAFGEQMEPESRVEGVSVDASRLRRYAGTYQSSDGYIWKFERKEDTLLIEGEQLIPLSDTLFQEKGGAAQLSFQLGPEGGVTGATYHSSVGYDRTLRPVESWSPTAEELRAFAGRYYSPELETVYTIAVQDGQLVAHHRWHGEVALSAPGPKNTFQDEKGRGLRIRFERNEVGLVTGFYASTGGTRNVWFQRWE